MDLKILSSNKLIPINLEIASDLKMVKIALKNKPVFSVQYHPEASAGPHDSRYLFDTFIENMKAQKN